jgi:hypothetical protein
MHRAILVLLAGLAAVASEVADAPVPLPDPPAAAKQAVAKAIEASRKQRDAYEGTLRTQTEKLIKELESQHAALVRKGDGEAARAVRALIDRVGDGMLREEAEAEFDPLGQRIERRRERELELGLSGDDVAECWINGARVASATFNQPAKAVVRVTSGDLLVCRVVNTGGQGGLALALIDEKRQLVLSTATPADWRVYEPRDPARWWQVERRELAEAKPAQRVEDSWTTDGLQRLCGVQVAPLWGQTMPGTWCFAAVVP